VIKIVIAFNLALGIYDFFYLMKLLKTIDIF